MASAMKKMKRPELEDAPLTEIFADSDAPLAEMFADSDDDLRVISPSKSARRRMRRQRQRDALRAAACSHQEAEVPLAVEALHGDSEQRAHVRTIVTLDKLGFELGGYGKSA